MSDVVFITLRPDILIDVDRDEFRSSDGKWHRIHSEWNKRAVGDLLRARTASGHAIITVRRKDREADEHARMCLFFHGKRPNDPCNLPSPPRIHGWTWDELSEW